MKITIPQVKNDVTQQLVAFHFPKLGVTIKKMPAKIGGCFQKDWSRVTALMS